eukprot:TRINITY_DN4261_c0_g1_i1.p1 TRINITY_DN4261_c0_g1~~TRINITY_DN4261_c0_g1_i1.p1  ORF type:complete len:1150 (+),score=222.36 TRINITY_DN4261_c0_g1_i1:214-3663(+)
MVFAVGRPYACPICLESFTKWGMCQAHASSSAPCRNGLGDRLQDVEALQELCRSTAKSAAADSAAAAGTGGPKSISHRTVVASSADGVAAKVAATLDLDGSPPQKTVGAAQPWMAPIPTQTTATAAPSAESESSLAPALAVKQQALAPGQADVHLSSALPRNALAQQADKMLHKASKRGYFTDAARNDTAAIFDELVEQPESLQIAVVKKFLSPAAHDFRWINNKAHWLRRCWKFCQAGDENNQLHNPSLATALADQALLPDVLPQEHWQHFEVLPPEVQERVVYAVRCSLFANARNGLSKHFENICYNERSIYIHEMQERRNEGACGGRSPPAAAYAEQVERWEDLGAPADEPRSYQRLFSEGLLQARGNEEQALQALRELAYAARAVLPGEPGSLLHDHLRTAELRRRGVGSRKTAEELSLLHAAASSGLVRVCARLIAEGFDYNEASGLLSHTPLHVAAANGEVEVVRLLVTLRADLGARDVEGHSPLFMAVKAAVDLRKDIENSRTLHSLQVQVFDTLVSAGAKNTVEGIFDGPSGIVPRSPETLAHEHALYDLYNLSRLHGRVQTLKKKHKSLDETSIRALFSLQYETAVLVIRMFERSTKVSADAAPTEFRALIGSDFVQSRDKIQVLGNRLQRRLPHLKKRAISRLADLPAEAALTALKLWKVEEVQPKVYGVPGYLNVLPKPPPPPPLPPPPSAVLAPAANVDGGDSEAGAETRENHDDVDVVEDTDARHEEEQPLDEPVSLGTGAYLGRVRKWNSERGFGFIVLDAREGEESCKDIFVHRKNIVGNGPSNHIDLHEQGRVCFDFGEQDGKCRALEVMMLDSNNRPLSVHRGVRNVDAPQGAALGSDPPISEPEDCGETDSDEGQRLTKRFLRHLKHPEVLKICKEKRAEGESWLRCVGLKRHSSGRRDDTVWKKEIERRVDIFLSRTTAPLLKKDFDYRVRRTLHEICLHSSVANVSELLAMVESVARDKSRNDVQSWPAYLATLLKRFGPKPLENFSERSRNNRRRPEATVTSAPQAWGINVSRGEQDGGDGGGSAIDEEVESVAREGKKDGAITSSRSHSSSTGSCRGSSSASDRSANSNFQRRGAGNDGRNRGVDEASKGVPAFGGATAEPVTGSSQNGGTSAVKASPTPATVRVFQ